MVNVFSKSIKNSLKTNQVDKQTQTSDSLGLDVKKLDGGIAEGNGKPCGASKFKETSNGSKLDESPGVSGDLQEVANSCGSKLGGTTGEQLFELVQNMKLAKEKKNAFVFPTCRSYPKEELTPLIDVLDIIEKQAYESSLREVLQSTTLSGTESPEAKMGSISDDSLITGDPSTSSELLTDDPEVAFEDHLKEISSEKCPFESFISGLEEFAESFIKKL